MDPRPQTSLPRSETMQREDVALTTVDPTPRHVSRCSLSREAVISYTHYLAEIDEGRSENVPAPEIVRRYWGLPDNATLRDVVMVVRADEAHHRDVNHGFAKELGGLPAGMVVDCPPHVALEPIWKKVAGARRAPQEYRSIG